MTTRTGAALDALEVAINAAASISLPALERNRTLDDAFSALDGGALAYLNMVDGDVATLETQLGGEEPYELSQSATFEWFVKADTEADLRAAFEAGLLALDDALDADRTLGGVVDNAEITGLRRDNLATEGISGLRAAEIDVVMTLTSDRPF
ncbi:hypothetical protein [Breoghania sp.]|uniref:hypothetical protein n=1 Tax=Breoghania sp. TaxID=2065378 RepID=UPI002AAC3C24|nr:hypothetical protein [Breoghania sp.]